MNLLIVRSIFTSGIDTNVNEVANQADQQNVMSENIGIEKFIDKFQKSINSIYSSKFYVIDFNTDNEFNYNDHHQHSTTAQKFKIPPKCISKYITSFHISNSQFTIDIFIGIFFRITKYLFPISPLWTLIETSCKNNKILKSYKVIYTISLIWLFLFSYLMHWTFINLGQSQ